MRASEGNNKGAQFRNKSINSHDLRKRSYLEVKKRYEEAKKKLRETEDLIGKLQELQSVFSK